MVDPENARLVSRSIPRRSVLIGLTGAVLAVPAAGLLAGCGSGEPDPLEALALRARRDVTLINQARASGDLPAATAQRLTELASARQAHAQALAVELGAEDSSDDTESSTPNSSSSGSDLPAVLTALEKSRSQAGALVTSLPRRRASLVGSIAACCAAYHQVLS